MPRFRLFWLATAISSFGEDFFAVALPWLVLQLSQSELALGGVLTAAAIPRAALMLPGGALSDRLSPARVLVVASLARAVFFGTVAWLVAHGAAQLWHLYAFAIVFGVLDAIAAPAGSTIVPSLAKGAGLTTANSVIQSTTQASGLVAPALAGRLVSMAGTGATLAVCAATSALAGGIMALTPKRAAHHPAGDPVGGEPKSGSRTSVGASTLDVIRAIWRDPALRAFLLLIAGLSLATVGPLAVGLPSLARRRFGGSAEFGLMLLAAGAGTLAGTLLGGWFRRVRRRGKVLLIVNALIGLFMCVLGSSHSMLVAMAAIVLMAFGSGFVNLVAIASLQEGADRAVLGRLMSTLMLASIGPAPLSFLLAGAAGHIDPGLLFVASGVFVLVATALAAFSRPLRTVD